MEITIISAQGLKSPSSSNPLSWPLRAFATVTTVVRGGLATGAVHKTRVDVQGGYNSNNSNNPAWGEKFWIAVDPTMFYHGHLCVHLGVHTKHFLFGQALLGWCQIPAADVIDGLFPAAGGLRHLSYRLREKDGSRGHGVINVAVKLDGTFFQGLHVQPPCTFVYDVSMTTHQLQEAEPVIGIPIGL